jgi:hypothetical protein
MAGRHGTSFGRRPRRITGRSAAQDPRELSIMHLTAPAGTGRTDTRPRMRDADGMAVASFVLGLLGLLVLNLFLGPIAIVLAVAALWRDTARRGRAYLGLALGVADLVVLVTAMEMTGSVSWTL